MLPGSINQSFIVKSMQICWRGHWAVLAAARTTSASTFRIINHQQPTMCDVELLLLLLLRIRLVASLAAMQPKLSTNECNDRQRLIRLRHFINPSSFAGEVTPLPTQLVSSLQSVAKYQRKLLHRQAAMRFDNMAFQRNLVANCITHVTNSRR